MFAPARKSMDVRVHNPNGVYLYWNVQAGVADLFIADSTSGDARMALVVVSTTERITMVGGGALVAESAGAPVLFHVQVRAPVTHVAGTSHGCVVFFEGQVGTALGTPAQRYVHLIDPDLTVAPGAPINTRYNLRIDLGWA